LGTQIREYCLCNVTFINGRTLLTQKLHGPLWHSFLAKQKSRHRSVLPTLVSSLITAKTSIPFNHHRKVRGLGFSFYFSFLQSATGGFIRRRCEIDKGVMSFGGLSVALSLVFGCLLLLALCAQLYYFLWWKKRRVQMDIPMDHGDYAKGVFYWGCWKTPCSMHGGNAGGVVRDMENTIHEPEMELDLLQKSFGEEGVESELMRLHNLAGPPRFLFPIKEETKEDLESEDGKSRGDRSRKGSRTRSLSDIMLTIDTPFLTPVASSPLKCPLALDPLHCYKHQGFNPLFESSAELDYNRFRSSPPPKFKFLRDAEEKLQRRLMEEARRKSAENVQECGVKDSSPNETTMDADFSDGSFLKFIQNKDTTTTTECNKYLPQFPSGSSQILPLASSPTTLRPLEKASIVH